MASKPLLVNRMRAAVKSGGALTLDNRDLSELLDNMHMLATVVAKLNMTKVTATISPEAVAAAIEGAFAVDGELRDTEIIVHANGVEVWLDGREFKGGGETLLEALNRARAEAGEPIVLEMQVEIPGPSLYQGIIDAV